MEAELAGIQVWAGRRRMQMRDEDPAVLRVCGVRLAWHLDWHCGVCGHVVVFWVGEGCERVAMRGVGWSIVWESAQG
jgi:hypothetical protein